MKHTSEGDQGSGGACACGTADGVLLPTNLHGSKRLIGGAKRCGKTRCITSETVDLVNWKMAAAAAEERRRSQERPVSVCERV